MTDTNTTPAAEAVERVAKAMWADDSEGYSDLHAGMYEDFQKQATAAIAAHTAYLWQRAEDSEVVEDVFFDGHVHAEGGGVIRVNTPALIRSVLTALIGPQPTVVGTSLEDAIAEEYDRDPAFAAEWDEIKKESTDAE